jgi:hypothetical protein
MATEEQTQKADIRKDRRRTAPLEHFHFSREKMMQEAPQCDWLPETARVCDPEVNWIGASPDVTFEFALSCMIMCSNHRGGSVR